MDGRAARPDSELQVAQSCRRCAGWPTPIPTRVRAAAMDQWSRRRFMLSSLALLSSYGVHPVSAKNDDKKDDKKDGKTDKKDKPPKPLKPFRPKRSGNPHEAPVGDAEATPSGSYGGSGTGVAGSAATLVLYDTTGEFGWLGELYGTMAANLVSHFGSWTAQPITSYVAGQMSA